MDVEVPIGGAEELAEGVKVNGSIDAFVPSNGQRTCIL